MSVIELPGLPEDPQVEGRKRLATNLDKLRAVLRAQALVAKELELEDISNELAIIAMLVHTQRKDVDREIANDEQDNDTV